MVITILLILLLPLPTDLLGDANEFVSVQAVPFHNSVLLFLVMIADVEVPPDPPPLAKLAILVVSVHDEPFQVSTFVEFGLFDVTIAAVVVPVRGLSVPVEFVSQSRSWLEHFCSVPR